MLYTILVVAQVLVAVALIGLVLIQQGKGADAGAAFGSGSSATVFGSAGAGNFITRATYILAISFFVLSTTLAFVVNSRGSVTKSVAADLAAKTAAASTSVAASVATSVAKAVPVVPSATKPAAPVVPN
jgi:preprotein translocase subunit SecG